MGKLDIPGPVLRLPRIHGPAPDHAKRDTLPAVIWVVLGYPSRAVLHVLCDVQRTGRKSSPAPSKRDPHAGPIRGPSRRDSKGRVAAGLLLVSWGVPRVSWC